MCGVLWTDNSTSMDVAQHRAELSERIVTVSPWFEKYDAIRFIGSRELFCSKNLPETRSGLAVV